MHVRLRLDGRHPRRWHRDLVRRLGAAADTTVEVEFAASGPSALPGNAETLFTLERLIFGLPARAASAPLTASERAGLPAVTGRAPDLILDFAGDLAGNLAGNPDGAAGPRTWHLRYDGQDGEAGLLASLLAGRAPWATVSEGGRAVASARLGTEMQGRVATAFDDGLAHTVTLILAALKDAPGAGPSGARPPAAPIPDLSPGALARRGGRMLAQSIVQRLYRLCFRAPHWRVGWRHLDGPGVVDLQGHPPSGWATLRDDGHRFYADPFPLAHGGTTWLFVEEFPHATQKGVISAVAMGRDGPVGTPRPVLEEAHHLSYPFVFARDGAIWMVPERAPRDHRPVPGHGLPGGLGEGGHPRPGVVASDATLLEQEGRWWLFATVRDAPVGAPLGLGSYSDALHLCPPPISGTLDAPCPQPRPHRHRLRAPGRAIVRRATGGLVRPVQDCTDGYGRALGLARIDRLDDGGFGQTVETVLRAGPEWPGSRLHTLNSGGGFEFIDGSARAPRLP